MHIRFLFILFCPLNHSRIPYGILICVLFLTDVGERAGTFLWCAGFGVSGTFLLFSIVLCFCSSEQFRTVTIDSAEFQVYGSLGLLTVAILMGYGLHRCILRYHQANAHENPEPQVEALQRRGLSFGYIMKIIMDFLLTISVAAYGVRFPEATHGKWHTDLFTIFVGSVMTTSCLAGRLLIQGPIDAFGIFTSAAIPLVTFFLTEQRWLMAILVAAIYLYIATGFGLLYYYLWKKNRTFLLCFAAIYLVIFGCSVAAIFFLGRKLMVVDKEEARAHAPPPCH